MFACGVSAGVLTRSQAPKASRKQGSHKVNPISVAKHRIVAGVETERPHLRETNFAALGFFAASITPDFVNDGHWFDDLDLHLDLRC